MPLLNDIHSIAVPAASANFTAHTYTEIYAGVTVTPIINGQSIALAAGSSIKLKIYSISGATGCTLLGETINNKMDSPTLGGTY